jgi:hypothetical protein
MAGIEQVNPKIEVNLDRPRYFWLNFSAMAAFEKHTGKSIFDVMANPRATDYIICAWACLLHEDKTLTIEKVTELIDAAGPEYITERLSEAVKAAFPKATAKGKKE